MALHVFIQPYAKWEAIYSHHMMPTIILRACARGKKIEFVVFVVGVTPKIARLRYLGTFDAHKLVTQSRSIKIMCLVVLIQFTDVIIGGFCQPLSLLSPGAATVYCIVWYRFVGNMNVCYLYQAMRYNDRHFRTCFQESVARKVFARLSRFSRGQCYSQIVNVYKFYNIRSYLAISQSNMQ